MKFIHLLGIVGILSHICSGGVIPENRKRLRRQGQQWFQSDIYKQPSSGGDNTGMNWLAGNGMGAQIDNTGTKFHQDPGSQGQHAPPRGQGQWYQSDIYKPPTAGGDNTGMNWLAGGEAGRQVPWLGVGQADQPKWKDQPTATLSYADRRALEGVLSNQKTKWEWDQVPTHDVQASKGNGPIHKPYAIGPDGRPHFDPYHQEDPTFQTPPPGYYNGLIQPNPKFPPNNIFDTQPQQPWDNQYPPGSDTNLREGDGFVYPDPNEYEYNYYDSHGATLRSRKEKVFLLLLSYICISFALE